MLRRVEVSGSVVGRSLSFVRLCVCVTRARDWPRGDGVWEPVPVAARAGRAAGAWGPAVRRRKCRPRPRGEESAVGEKNFSVSDWGHHREWRNVALAAFRPRAAVLSLRWQWWIVLLSNASARREAFRRSSMYPK